MCENESSFTVTEGTLQMLRLVSYSEKLPGVLEFQFRLRTNIFLFERLNRCLSLNSVLTHTFGLVISKSKIQFESITNSCSAPLLYLSPPLLPDLIVSMIVDHSEPFRGRIRIVLIVRYFKKEPGFNFDTN